MNELPKWLIHYLYNQLNFLAIFAPLREQMPLLGSTVVMQFP